MGNRWSRSWSIAKQSLAVLRGNPQLMGFPIVSGLSTLLITISFFVPGYLLFRAEPIHDKVPPVYYVLLAAYYLASYFVVIFFNVGMVACTKAALEGRRMTFGEGIHEAGRHLGAIIGWTLVSATVGMLLQLAKEELGWPGRILSALIGGAWNIITYFVVPAIAFENKGPISAVKESASLLRRTWGEQLIGESGIGLAVFAFVLLPVPIIVLACVTQVAWAIVASLVVSCVYWTVLATVATSLGGIYRTALYVYAGGGQAPSAFAHESIANAFRPKKR